MTKNFNFQKRGILTFLKTAAASMAAIFEIVPVALTFVTYEILMHILHAYGDGDAH